MKLLVFSLAFCLSLLTFAQPDTSLTAEQTKAMLETEFSKVDKTKLSALVPFKKNGKWGFIYADTRKVAVKPCFTFINLFNPDFIGFCNEWEVEITAKPFLLMCMNNAYFVMIIAPIPSNGFLSFLLN
jgi:hypothetical protein